jgi:hypothetical protein
MSKADKDEIVFDKKSSMNIIIENDSEDDEKKNDNFEYEDDNVIDENYDKDALNFIEDNLLEYVKKRAIPLCEYITVKSIDTFLNKINA